MKQKLQTKTTIKNTKNVTLNNGCSKPSVGCPLAAQFTNTQIAKVTTDATRDLNILYFNELRHFECTPVESCQA